MTPDDKVKAVTQKFDPPVQIGPGQTATFDITPLIFDAMGIPPEERDQWRIVEIKEIPNDPWSKP